MYNRYKKQAQQMLGYQVNQNFSETVSVDYGPYLSYMINNCGDPYDDVALPNTKGIEREVLNYFYSLFGGTSEDTWGYMGAGGTEGNMWGLYNGRLYLDDPIVLYSSDAHYSVKKALDMMQMDSVEIPSDGGTGSMSYEDLEETVRYYSNCDILVLATYGTTFYGGYDNLRDIKEIIANNHAANHYIHLDGAFGAPYMAYLGGEDSNLLDYCDSLSFSLHKLYGLPIPASVILCKKDAKRVGENLIEYVSSHDSTICGSRPGIVPLLMRDLIISTNGDYWFHTCNKLAERAKILNYMLAYKRSSITNLYHNSNCVVFNKPAQWIIDKYSLSCQDGLAHIWVMPHVTELLLSEFIKDLDYEKSLKKTIPMDETRKYSNVA